VEGLHFARRPMGQRVERRRTFASPRRIGALCLASLAALVLSLLAYTVGLAAWNPAYPWDVNGDGVVDIGDVVLIGLHLGETGPPGWITADVPTARPPSR
jgi:hypothetical protein